ncbi:hypothetical protein THRCLA_04700 [Thraustotheca clavata]|uniref:Rho-GAP domain-containing protein n=1 Tax=Thraustotheca clavata TaxID=74557 RepID=A0A1V9ZYA2_9STRA|nr:hypothetical protein THRCLA_04700 [Thraustotheca clavata]
MPLLYKAPRYIGTPFAISHDLHVEYNYEAARFEVQGVPESNLALALNQHFSVDMRTLPGVALEPYHERIPAILVMLEHHFVRHQGNIVPYIFRESPGKAARDDAIAAVNTGTFCGDNVDVRIVADLIKVWFRELPIPLLHGVSMEDMDKFQKLQSTIVPSLGTLEHAILLWLADLLLSVAESETINHMGVDQLAIILAPNLIRIDTPNPMVAVATSKASVDFLRHFLKQRCAERKLLI